MGRPKKIIPKKYRCTRCGSEWDSSRNFFTIRGSELYRANDDCSNLCRTCINEMFSNYVNKYNSNEKACQIMCAKLDIPYIKEVYEQVNSSTPQFELGLYVRRLNNRQYQRKDFSVSIVNNELVRTGEQVDDDREERWTKDEKRIRDEVIAIVGYDCFMGFKQDDRRVLFPELAKYIGDEEDNWKISQTIKAITTDYQITRYDRILSRLDVLNNADDYDRISALKKDAVTSLDKIAKENEISMKHRSNKTQGSGTLTHLMRDLREKGIDGAEANYYDQLRSEGTRWAADMSMKAMWTNGHFDENDMLEINEEHHKLVSKLYSEVDELKETNRILYAKLAQMGVDISELKPAPEAEALMEEAVNEDG